MKRTVLGMVLALPLVAQAQSWSRTETITYHDNPTVWVLGQTAKVICVAPAECTPSWAPTGIVMSETTYDTLARPVTVKSFGKLTQTLTYDTTSTVASGQLGTLKTVKDGNNNVTTFGNWKRGIPQAITHADSTSQSAVVDDRGWIDSVTDENGYKTCYTYDTMGRLASITYPSESAANACDTTEASWKKTLLTFQPVAVVEYGIPVGHWRQTVSTGAGQKITYYDALWRPLVTKELDATNGTAETLTKRFQRFAYDAEGRTTFASYPGTTDALTKGTWTEYDALGRVTSVSQDSELAAPSNLLTTTTQYLTGFKTLVTSPKGQVTTTSYQTYDQPSYDWPVAITHPEGTYTDISRDVYGKVLTITRRNAGNTAWQRRYYVYNAAQELCKSTETETGTTAYGYDGAGNLSWSAAGLSWSPPGPCEHTKEGVVARRVDRTYDARNRVKTLVFPDGRGNTTNTYAPDGQLASTAVDNDGTNVVTTTYSYNRRRLPTSERMQWGSIDWSIGYTYNALGHLASQTYPNTGTVTYAPNGLGQPTQAGTYATGVTYHPNGAVKNFTYGNGMVYTMAQNARGLPTWSVDCLIAGDCTLSNRRKYLAYTYDGNGNVATITDHVNGRQTRAMTYDGLDRLTQATGPSFGTATYGYNALDNMTTLKVTAGSNIRDHTYNYDTGNRLISVTNTVGGATVVGLSYDAQGNLANQNGRVFNFDYGNRLRGVNGVASYVYDGHGRRVRDYTTASKYSLYSQSGQLVFDNDGRAGKSSQYVYLGTSLVAVREVAGSVTTVKYQHTDALGTPVAVTDAAKAIVQTSEYEPYGQLVNRPLTDGPGFTGHVQDAATGLTYMQQRYYDPLIGRFLSVDPVTAYEKPVTNFCRYCYARNNPYRFTDPDGRDTVGEMIDQEASAAAQRGDNLATYGWAFTAAAWNILGAEGVSQITDKGLSGTGNGSKAGAAVELASVLPVVKAARAVATPVKSLIKADSFLVKAAESAGKSVQKSLDGLVSQLSKGNMNPGIGTKHLFSGIFEARARDGARVYFRQTEGGGIEVVAKSSKQNQEQVIGRLKDMYEK
ncbi:RHS repeat domain-containing protein [Pseudoxanthomonas beigongshangi]|uniref:RHS repeat domain-containing protein n=1 Tax=Pseudoxanthomonas beigongshangi TaxID=2782537 RepID=UPI00193BFA94|nr:RHS repeat-associated core domain-containing protein [Pseudoxanthomonas beigongshangi]